MDNLLILILVFLSGPALMWGILRIWKWKRERSGSRPPFEDLLLRSPGERLRGEIADISDDIDTYLLSASMFPLLLFGIYMTRVVEFRTLLMWLLGAGFMGFLIWRIVTLIKRRRDLRLGLAGEMATGEELNRLMLEGHRVYHDFPAERFNIDHILVGPAGVFAVETKARSKGSTGDRKEEAKVIYEGERLRFPNWVTTEPIDQAKAQAAWLTKWLSSAVGDPVKVSPMVTIPGWFIERKSPNGVPVLNPKQVKTYLGAKKEVLLSESMIKRICHQLEQRCRDVHLWDWY
jgi:hypothetical protein